MQGRIVVGRALPFQLNDEFCTVCGAAKNTPCIRQGGEGRGNRRETHRAEADRRKIPWPPSREQARRLGRGSRRPR